MVKAKFIGRYMDGEWRIIPRAIPRYSFPRYKALSIDMNSSLDISKPVPIWTEDYELDSWEGDRVFYRRVGLPQQ